MDHVDGMLKEDALGFYARAGEIFKSESSIFVNVKSIVEEVNSLISQVYVLS